MLITANRVFFTDKGLTDVNNLTLFAASEQDVEYELEEVWDGAKWHVVHKMVPKKTNIGNVMS